MFISDLFGGGLEVKRKERVGGPFIGYWYSKSFQTHNCNIGKIVFTWRFGKFEKKK